MVTNLIQNQYVGIEILPERIRGRFWLKGVTESGQMIPLVSVEGVEGRWVAKSNPRASILDENANPVKEVILAPPAIHRIKAAEIKDDLFVFIEPVTVDRQTFSQFLVMEKQELTIGRAVGNDICFSNEFISNQHASIRFQNGGWIVTDRGSKNGIFRNGCRIQQHMCAPGDLLYIMGLKIILGRQFFAINCPDGRVVIEPGKVIPLERQAVPHEDGAEYEPPAPEFFYRSPRFKRDLEKAAIRVDSPPQNEKGDSVPAIMTLGPSITMGMASMSTALFSVNAAIAAGNIAAALPSMVMCGSMLLGTLMWPLISKSFTGKRAQVNEIKRQELYRAYLDQMAVQFSEEAEQQEMVLREIYPSLTECEQRILEPRRSLWERERKHNDFLQLRAGSGNLPLLADIIYSQKGFSIMSDQLERELYTLCERPKILENVPIAVSFFESYITGIIGKHDVTIQFVRSLIIQLVALYSYDELKIVLFYDANDEDDFRFAKWLPHVWADGQNIRFIATNENDAKDISSFIERSLAPLLQTGDTVRPESAAGMPYYVVFAVSKHVASYAELIKHILGKDTNANVSLVACYNELYYLPKECSTVIELNEDRGRVIDRDDITKEAVPFVLDGMVNADQAERMAVALANIHLDDSESNFQLPNMITFLQMFGVGKVEHLNPSTRWRENDPTKTLATPIGVDTLGNLFMLDLHEKYHGPHGLVAGMTGSGKSEFIITFILSLAVNYHPDELAFILIDYKGGGMAKAFENLPHTAGIITNLDGAAVKRSLVSIESELKRRQAIFGETSKKTGVSNIDIYKYQKLYREKSVEEPLQHLFIISDEFAELKTQQPEFMAQLISAARIGRSLGVHLILATQKPSGVVDDQIWSNSKFRVCLKVQERADSMDMLKREDAANLVNTGRFYLQVGYNELFEMGQSAWAGAPYQPADQVIVEKDNGIEAIDAIGRVIRQVKPKKKENNSDDQQKQLDAITDYLQLVAKEEHIKVRPLWLPPIAQEIYVDALREQYPDVDNERYVLNPLLGIYDDPAFQRQCIFTLPLSQEGNTLIFGMPNGGKTTFLSTLLYSTMQKHTPQEVNFYVLDFASETLRAFSQSPHVGDVVLSYENEKITNLFKLLTKEVEGRKKLFSDYGGDYQSYIAAGKDDKPNIVVAINNYAAFSELYEDICDSMLSTLAREGTKYGIYFILATVGSNSIRFRMMQNFNQQYVLQMNDESEYSSILGKTDGLVPAKYKGRGLFKQGAVYEFQTAYALEDPAIFVAIRQYCEKYRDCWEGAKAKRIPILPAKLDASFLADYIQDVASLRIPIGVSCQSLETLYYPFQNSTIALVLAESDGYLDFFGSMVDFLATKYTVALTLLDPRQECQVLPQNGMTISASSKDCAQTVDELFQLSVQRNNQAKEAQEKGDPLPAFEKVLVFINSIASLQKMLNDRDNKKLSLMLENNDKKFNLFFVLGSDAKEIADRTHENWYRTQVVQNEGIWVGGGITEQYTLKTSKNTRDMQEDLPNNFGFVVEKGRAHKVKLLSRTNGEDGNE